MIITKATYQQISKAAMVSDGFDKDDSFIELVKNTAKEIEGLGINAKLAIEAGYIFSRKVPQEERQDLFQELVTAILESGTEDAAFAYTIARRDWQNWWSKYALHSQFYEGYLSDTLTNSDGDETELAELLIGEVEFENKQIDKLDAKQLWQQIPADIQKLVTTLNDTERKRLNRWVKTEGYKLLIN